MRHRVELYLSLSLSLISTVCLLSPAAAQEYYHSSDAGPVTTQWASARSAVTAESQPQEASLATLAALNTAASEASVNVASSCDCCTSACDCAKLAKAVSGAYKGVFYDNNFNYLCDPCYADWHLGEYLKRRSFGDNVTVDVGGEYRVRYHNEHNIRGRALTGLGDEFILQRLRVYSNVELGQRVRFYAEALDANSAQENLPPRAIEENSFDAINLFVEANVWR